MRFHHDVAGDAFAPDSLLRGPVTASVGNGPLVGTGWDGCDADVSVLRELLTELRSGELSAHRAVQLSGLLGKMLPAGKPLAAIAADAVVGIEATASSGDDRFLTDIPWELLPLQALPPGAAFDAIVRGTLASRSLVRVVQTSGSKPGLTPRNRPRLLFAVADVRAAHLPRVELEKYEQSIRGALKRVAAFDIRVPRCGADELTGERLRQNIMDAAPHILVLVAHGKAADQQSAAEVYLAGGAIQVATLATWLRETNENCATVLACCDLASGSSHAATSGAARLVLDGVPQVLAMQGFIDQTVASLFLESLLTSMFERRGLAAATQIARGRVSKHGHGLLPTVFQSSTVAAAPPPLNARIEEFEARRREAQAKLIQSRAELLRGKSPVPREVMPALGAALNAAGVCTVFGPAHCGKRVAILDAAAQAMQDGSMLRPILQLGSVATQAQLIEGLESLLSKHEVLLPRGRARMFGMASASVLAETIDDHQVTILMEADETRIRSDWLLDFLRQCHAGNTRSLVILSCTKLPAIEGASIEMDYFSTSEVQRFLAETAPELGPQAERVRELTGGHPVLLEAIAVRRHRHGGITIDEVEAITDSSAVGSLADEVVDALTSLTTPDGPNPAEILELLTRLREPVSVEISVANYLPLNTDDAHSLLDDLESLGAVTYDQTSDERTWQVAPLLRDAVAARLATHSSGASLLLRDKVVDVVEVHGAEQLGRTFRGLGGPSILAAVQAALLDETAGDPEWDLALAIASFADDGDLHAAQPGLYEPLTKECVPKKVRCRALIRRGSLLHALRDVDGADACLQTLMNLDVESGLNRAEMLMLSANIRKSRDQSLGVEPALAELREARQLLFGTDDYDSRRLLYRILQAEINTLLFLKGDPAVEARPLIELLKHAPQEIARGSQAELHSTLSEYYRKAEAPDWQAVGHHALEGYALSGKPGVGEQAPGVDGHRRSYCLYQYAKYLHLAPQGRDLPNAVRCYEECAVLARQSQVWNRYALATYNAISIKTNDLHKLVPAAAIAGLEEVMNVAPRFWTNSDSLTFRAASRVCGLQALLASTHNLAAADVYARNTCRALMGLRTPSRGDLSQFVRAATTALVAFQRFGDTPAAQSFVREISPFVKDKMSLEFKAIEPWNALLVLQQFGR